MSKINDLLGHFECHSPQGIRDVLAAGISPTEPIGGKAPIVCLIEMYLRSPKFVECLQVMLDAGADIEDPILKAILLDDAVTLRRLLKPIDLKRKHSMECTFTSLKGVTALHICAEYNSVRCAAVLVKAGANVNARATMDADGLGGHTPLFHTLNQHKNFCRPMMELLIKAGAKLDVRLKGLVWGGGFEWETVLFDVTPISYTQCGLIKQFQRDETDIYSNINYLYKKLNGKKAPIRNVPNKYLLT